jgi:hypothetical protein
MAASPCVVLYGNSVFLAGIRADLEGRTELKLLKIEPDCPDAADRIRACRPTAILFDLCATQPDFAIALLREQPGPLLIGVDPSSDELLVLSSHPAQALSVADLVKVIQQKQSSSEPLKGE